MLGFAEVGEGVFKVRLCDVTKRRPRLAVVVAMLFLIIATQSGNCLAATGAIKFPYFYSSLVDFSFPSTISVPDNPAIGQVLYSTSYQPGIATSNVTCPVTENAVVNGSAAAGQTNIFMTNVPGIGVRYRVTKNWNGQGTYVPYTETFSVPVTNNQQSYIFVELVVTGPVGNGTLAVIPSMTITFSGTCLDTVTQTQYVTPGSVVGVSTCNVTTSSIYVSMPRVPPSSLPSVGATAGATPFSIGLNCNASANAYLSLSDASNPGNSSSVLSTSPDSTAQGVGFQIAMGSTTLSFGSGPLAKGDMSALSAGRLNAGKNQIPLVVSYVRTGAITSGWLKGLVMFSMSYQ